MKTLAVNMRRCCHSPDGGHQLKICVPSIKNLRAIPKVQKHFGHLDYLQYIV
jgi:hypothetical protein